MRRPSRSLLPFLLLTALTLTSPRSACAAPDDAESVASTASAYSHLQHIPLDEGAATVTTLLQDSCGMVWLGTDRGICSYDGYHVFTRRDGGLPFAGRVHCGLVADKRTLYFGTDQGLLAYDIFGDRLEAGFPAPLNSGNVRALALAGDTLWVGSDTGLSAYAPGGRRVGAAASAATPHADLLTQAVYALCATRSDSALYVGTADGLVRRDLRTGQLEPVSLPLTPAMGATATVSALCEDTLRHCLWVGTEGELFRCDLATRRAEAVSVLSGNSLRALAFDDQDRLVAGTGNGVYVLRPAHLDAAPQHVMRDARDASSLPNDEVRCVWRDRDGDMWFGTDDGLAMLPLDDETPFTPIWQITGTGRGNRFSVSLLDSHGALWLGGVNGLIRTVPTLDDADATRWYRTDNATAPLAHNHVRHVYEDADSTLWVATDGGIQHWEDGRWRPVHLVDSSHSYDVWEARAVLHDRSSDRLWVATATGGILVADRRHLLHASGSAPCVADAAIDTASGLASMCISQLVQPDDSAVWALAPHVAVHRISVRDLEVCDIPLPHGELEEPGCLLADSAGRVWVGVRGGVLCWTAADSALSAEPQRYAYTGFGASHTLHLRQVGSQVWAATSDGVWMIDPAVGSCRRLRDLGHDYLSIAYSPVLDRVYLGADDGLTYAAPADLQRPATQSRVQLTAIDVNGVPTFANGWNSVRFAEDLGFGAAQGHLVFHFSDYPYNRLVRDRFVYRLSRVDKQWRPLPAGSNLIEYSKLRPASYRLEISRVGDDGELFDPLVIPFRIYPPRYLSWWAFLIYVALFFMAGYFVVRYLLMRSRLGIERRERDLAMDQTREKMQLYGQMSAEFNRPIAGLSRPLGQLADSDLTPAQQDLVAEARQNVRELSDMVRHLTDYGRLDNASTLMLAEVDVVALVRRVYDGYASGAFRRNGLTSAFETDEERCVQLVDRIKLVAAVTAVMSNAARFTPPGGHIDVRLHIDDKNLVLTVGDDGVGIAPADLPHVTERHYQGANVRNHRQKGGMGLYLARLYVEMHGGKFDIQSTLGRGTKVTLTLLRGIRVDDYARLSLSAEEYIERIIDDEKLLAESRRELPSPYKK